MTGARRQQVIALFREQGITITEAMLMPGFTLEIDTPIQEKPVSILSDDPYHREVEYAGYADVTLSCADGSRRTFRKDIRR